jgi:hypothetical protein
MARLISDKEVQSFHQDGYVIVPGFFSQAEPDKLYSIAIGDNVTKQHALDLNDQTGKKTKLTLWFTPGNDVYSMMLRSTGWEKEVTTK